MVTQTHWRLAVMFDAPEHDLERLEPLLRAAEGALRSAAPGGGIRTGVAERRLDYSEHPDIEDVLVNWRSVDAAIEVTVPNARAPELPAIAAALRSPLADLAAPGSIEVMTGPINAIVPARRGDAFLSLAFHRRPYQTASAFSHWWINRHAVMAVPMLGQELLAYDQVHVESDASRAVADRLGVPFVDYAAYDNLTWGDYKTFLASVAGKTEDMALLAEDETDWIESNSHRQRIMRVVSQ